ncbi:hypothetical protein J7E88_22630 [Streptomyces sp. ISL-10]|uniref:hypothetical protein n=1 Tax=Streptomyces sp. ISL-10 TaxID=2819172 RepID=UPI001BE5A105|nr:hypothetical protein [Streptomyces sp. ISL-10]MBT2368032.1 hypothetical protein [Streptomyces sp. ISL-10]
MVSPFSAALKVFRPSRADRVQDPLIAKLQVARAWVGLVVTACVLVAYRSLAPKDLVDERLVQMGYSFFAMAGVFPVVIGGFILAARPPNRGLYLRRIRYPLLALATWFGNAFTLQVITDEGSQERLLGLAGQYADVAKGVGVLCLMWLLLFGLAGGFLSITYVLRTADIHELVPPLLSTTVAWGTALAGLVTNAYRGFPPEVAALLLGGAPLSVTAIAAFEVHRLRTRHGVTLRRALLR